ncbi:DNA-3-methyladenine glycosylase family protein [Kineococcus rhizosphaerae]|uniref:3-methyladenine DNA glycosylase/8-oxoguanine DNA glycosylase n=1 Tax=Kineococcus rhizosphaerae TaxID=559628 RepID=A0A2T0R072_9ACTN|nr:3-methyladenine DNA glycosylase [Kineococcus rhizosphaerae]PRY12516.1 3-methyladenine DNA glycosylase/8-oxoguanine DNA glycosylase [Kineococcus rhizosphaerae]
MTPDGELRWTPGRPVPVAAMLTPLRRGAGDPTHRLDPDGTFWRATRTPEGPVTLRVRGLRDAVEAQAWGPGADWVLAGVPELLGAADDTWADFVPNPEHPLLVQSWRANPHWRTTRTRAVFEAVSASALEQVVTCVEAFAAWRRLVQRFGEPAPGPGGLMLSPTPEQWTRIPSWEWLQAGVELRRRKVTILAASRATGLERTLGMGPEEADRALRSLPGIGVWTSAEVRQRAHGHADAFSFGDYHVAKNVSFALTGEVLDDAGCAEVIECYRGHRYRVQQLLAFAGVVRPRRAPRMTLPTHTPNRAVRRGAFSAR